MPHDSRGVKQGDCKEHHVSVVYSTSRFLILAMASSVPAESHNYVIGTQHLIICLCSPINLLSPGRKLPLFHVYISCCKQRAQHLIACAHILTGFPVMYLGVSEKRYWPDSGKIYTSMAHVIAPTPERKETYFSYSNFLNKREHPLKFVLTYLQNPKQIFS